MATIGDIILGEQGNITGFALSRVYVEGPIEKNGTIPRSAVIDTGSEDGVMTIDLTKAENPDAVQEAPRRAAHFCPARTRRNDRRSRSEKNPPAFLKPKILKPTRTPPNQKSLKSASSAAKIQRPCAFTFIKQKELNHEQHSPLRPQR
ncbi:MAG: hypothetical protein R3D55_13840 [Chloroflexota bacterium]